MTQPSGSQLPNFFKANVRDVRFLVFEQFKLGDLLGKAPFESWGREEVEMVLAGIARFATDELGPLNAVGDRAGCRLEDGQVYTPPGFKDAWKKLHESGFKTISTAENHGGQGGPFTLHAFVDELLIGGNAAFSMYAGLTSGAAEVVAHFGKADQRERYLTKMVDGRWAGTMCLTEPHAGSDVGASLTQAHRRPDGKYNIQGTKIFISAGDHDLTDNIVHLVLARVDGAPPGTKGLSLFVVPKRKVEADGSSGASNDVSVASIEHKMGINGSATCVLKFGEADDCVGELLGEQENLGMSQMFLLMNGARIGVALQGLALGSTAYLNALEYAKERKQGAHVSRWKDASAPRVAIIEHPDVRRMLIDMKAHVEGVRALIYKLCVHWDRAAVVTGKDDAQAAYHRGQVDLLVPIVKSYASDQGFRVCETAIQTYGGAGYLKDHPVEQYCRDAKITSIYEGTNHIQAMDLVGRKLAQGGGANLRAFLGDVGTFVAANAAHPDLGPEVKKLGEAAELVGSAVTKFLTWFGAGRIDMVALVANRFLEMMAEVAVAWLLLDAAKVALEALPSTAEGEPDHAFYLGKKHAAIYFARNVLPGVASKATSLFSEDSSAIAMPNEAF